MDMDIILVTVILDMVMLDILTPPPTMERERLRLNQRLNSMDMDIILVTVILDMVMLDILTPPPTMEREMLRLNQRLNSMDMDIIFNLDLCRSRLDVCRSSLDLRTSIPGIHILILVTVILDMVMLDILTQPTMDKPALIQKYLTNSVSIMLNLNLVC